MPKSDKHGIMDAVSALTTLGDEESGDEGEAKASPEKKDDDTKPAAAKRGSDDGGEPKPRYIPEHKKPDAALTFPEKVRDSFLLLSVSRACLFCYCPLAIVEHHTRRMCTRPS